MMDWFDLFMKSLFVAAVVGLVVVLVLMVKQWTDCSRAGGHWVETGTHTMILMPTGNGGLIPTWVPDTKCVIKEGNK